VAMILKGQVRPKRGRARHAQRRGTTIINVSKKFDKTTEILMNPVHWPSGKNVAKI